MSDYINSLRESYIRNVENARKAQIAEIAENIKKANRISYEKKFAEAMAKRKRYQEIIENIAQMPNQRLTLYDPKTKTYYLEGSKKPNLLSKAGIIGMAAEGAMQSMAYDNAKAERYKQALESTGPRNSVQSEIKAQDPNEGWLSRKYRELKGSYGYDYAKNYLKDTLLIGSDKYGSGMYEAPTQADYTNIRNKSLSQ